jgi:uncharacterized protein (TIGR00369 family)
MSGGGSVCDVETSFLLRSVMMVDGSDESKLKMTSAFSRAVPHNHALGIRVIKVSRAEALFELPYDARLVGNPDTGTLHGGAITALLDGCSGAAVFAALTEFVPIATLDLRIDYLKPAEPGKSVIGKATCYKLTRNVAFTRAVAYQGDPDDVIAHSVGTFMLSTSKARHER